jgi:hypothetical protein
MKKWAIRIILGFLVILGIIGLIVAFLIWDAAKDMDEKIAEGKKASAAGSEFGLKRSPQECLVETVERYNKCMEKWSAVECRWIEPDFLSSCLVAAGITEDLCRSIPRLSEDGTIQGQEFDYEEALTWTQSLCEFEPNSVEFDMCRRVFFVVRYQCDVKYPQR